MFFQEKAVILQPKVVFYVLNYLYPSNLESRTSYTTEKQQTKRYVVVYILQILKSRASYTTEWCAICKGAQLCISFKSWNQEHPIQQERERENNNYGCVYPSNLEIKSILYNPVQELVHADWVVYILQILKSRASYTTRTSRK